MKLVFLALLLFSPLTYLVQSNKAVVFDSKEVLRKVSDKLTNLKTIKYRYRRELNYSSEGFYNEMTGDVYLDFTSVEKTIGLRYQFSNQDVFNAYNGSESFNLNKRDKTIRIKNNPAYTDFTSLTSFYDSPVTLKNALPKIIADDTIPKIVTETVLNQTAFYVIEFILDKKSLDALGNFFPITIDRKQIYRVTVRKADYLPTEVFHGNNANKDFTKTSFDNLQVNPDSPSAASWFYSSYLNEYKNEKLTETVLIKSGQTAPEWKLPKFGTKAQSFLGQYKNKVVMLEFWIGHCGYCISAVPKLNAIERKYKNKDFKLIAINTYDSKEIIELFKINHQPVFEILYEGRETAKTYGVEGFPTIVLIDKTGKVIYAGIFDPEKIEELIDKNIQL